MLNAGTRIVNSWLFPVKDGFALVDTGYENGFTHFKKRLAQLNIALESIRYIFLTHAHDDHAGFLNQFLSESPCVKVIMSEKALEVLYRGQNSFVGGCSSYLSLAFCNLMGLLGKGEHRFPPLLHTFENRCLLVSAKNKQELEDALGGTIIFTPGHTADSISLLLKNGALFCGDAAMNGLPSLHKITIWVKDKAAFSESWRTIITLNPKRIYPGHGQAFACAQLKKHLPYTRKITLLALKGEASA